MSTTEGAYLRHALFYGHFRPQTALRLLTIHIFIFTGVRSLRQSGVIEIKSLRDFVPSCLVKFGRLATQPSAVKGLLCSSRGTPIEGKPIRGY